MNHRNSGYMRAKEAAPQRDSTFKVLTDLGLTGVSHFNPRKTGNVQNAFTMALGGFIKQTSDATMLANILGRKGERSLEHIRKVYDICSKMPFFNDIRQFIDEKDKKEAMIDFFRHVTLEKYGKGRMIFREGDIECEKVYVVIKGRVGVLRRNHNYFKNETKKEAGVVMPKGGTVGVEQTGSESPEKGSRKFFDPKQAQLTTKKTVVLSVGSDN